MLKVAVFRGSSWIGCQAYYLHAQYFTELRLNHLTPECEDGLPPRIESYLNRGVHSKDVANSWTELAVCRCDALIANGKEPQTLMTCPLRLCAFAGGRK